MPSASASRVRWIESLRWIRYHPGSTSLPAWAMRRCVAISIGSLLVLERRDRPHPRDRVDDVVTFQRIHQFLDRRRRAHRDGLVLQDAAPGTALEAHAFGRADGRLQAALRP